MPSTRRQQQLAAEAARSPDFSSLPDEILLNVVGGASGSARKLTYASLFAFGASCKTLQRITNDGRLWQHIKFLSKKSRHKLSDAQLRALLTRVDARSHTKSISLRGCVSVTGSGLSPLQGSVALLSADLRRASSEHRHPRALDGGEVARIVKPMAQLAELLLDWVDASSPHFVVASQGGMTRNNMCDSCVDVINPTKIVRTKPCKCCEMYFCASCRAAHWSTCERCKRRKRCLPCLEYNAEDQVWDDHGRLCERCSEEAEEIEDDPFRAVL